jgi:hypothetical protein
MPELQFIFTVKVTLAKQGEGPDTPEDYIREEYRVALEEAAQESVYSDEDVEYIPTVSVS